MICQVSLSLIAFVMELFIHLLYNSSELETQLDHVVSGYRIICHSSKWGPEKEGAPGMNH